MSTDKQPASSGQSNGEKEKEKEESSFSRWKKRFTTKTKKADISATPAAVTIMNIATTYRAASQRAIMRTLRRWKQNVDILNANEAAAAAAAAAKAKSQVASSSTSGLGLGLLHTIGSPINRPRQQQQQQQGHTTLPASSTSPKSPRSSHRFSHDRNTVHEEEEDDDDDGEEKTKGVLIPKPSGHPMTNAISSTHAFSSSPALPSVLIASSLPDSGTIEPTASPSPSGSLSVSAPRRRLASSTDSIDSVSSELSTASKRTAYANTWTSSKPMRPSIIATRRTPSMSPINLSGIDPALLSPTVAFRRSLGVRDSVMLTQAIQKSNSGTNSSEASPISSNRTVPAGSPTPPDIIPNAMAKNPRGSVLLGNIAEFGSAHSIKAGGEEQDVDDDDEIASSSELPSPASVLRRQNTRVVKKWRAAIKQIMALALWAKKRTVSRANVDVPQSVRDMAKHELAQLDTTDIATSTATAAHPVCSPSPASAAAGGWTPRNTLLEYMLAYRVPTAALEDLQHELKNIAGPNGHGLTTRKHLKDVLAAANEKLSSQQLDPELSARYPLEDRTSLSVDPHWCAFGFPDGLTLSLTPRVTQCYSWVMTLSDGIALFATYLRYDVPLMPNLPNAFNHGASSSPPSTSTTTSHEPKVKFWDEKHAAGAAGATPGAIPNKPMAPRMSLGALSTDTQSHAITHVASPLVPPSIVRAWSSPASPLGSYHHHAGLATFHPQAYTPCCLVLISHYPQLDVLRTIALQLFELACSGGVSPSRDGQPGVTLEAYLRALCFEIPLPIPRHAAVRFRIHRAVCTIQFCGVRGPTQSAQNLELLFRTLNVDNVIGVLAAILTENRILFHSTSLNMLTYTMQAFLQLLFPFQFWFSFVPQLTEEMLEAHQIPQPYLLGVHSKHLPQLTALDEVLIVDLDHDVLRCSHPLTALPQKEGRSLWMDWRRSYERICVTGLDQVEDRRTEMADKGSEVLTTSSASGQALGGHVTMRSSLRRTSFTTPGTSGGGGAGLAAAKPEGGVSSDPQQQAISIATVLPASVFSFDEEIYASLVRFYSDLLTGYKKFLFFIFDAPFFNAQGFLSQRVAREPTSLDFYKAFVSSRSFDVFIEEETQPDAYHDYFGSASEFTPAVNRIPTILAHDFGAAERVLQMPDPLNSSDGRVEVGVQVNDPDEVVQSVVIDPPSQMSSHATTITHHTPFSTPIMVPSPTPALRALHWSGMEQDLHHYKRTSSGIVARKPKQLSSTPMLTSSASTNGASGSSSGEHQTNLSPTPTDALGGATSQSASSNTTLGTPSAADKSKQQSKRSNHPIDSPEHRIKLMMSEIFSSVTLTKEEMKEFTASLQEPHMRRVFATILSQPKQAGGSGSGTPMASAQSNSSASLCLTQVGFEQLSKLVNSLLDVCLTSKDYASASAGALDVGNVYYKEENSARHVRTYLEATMKKHPLWQSHEFWRANLALALSQRAMKAEKAHAKSLPTSPTGDDEFVLQWMISSAHSMMANSVPHAKVEELMKDVCRSHHLTPESERTITEFLQKIKEAAQYW